MQCVYYWTRSSSFPVGKLAQLIRSAFTPVGAFSSSGITFQGQSTLQSNLVFPDISKSLFFKELCWLNQSLLKMVWVCLKKGTFFFLCVHDYCRFIDSTMQWLRRWGLFVGRLANSWFCFLIDMNLHKKKMLFRNSVIMKKHLFLFMWELSSKIIEDNCDTCGCSVSFSFLNSISGKTQCFPIAVIIVF